MTLEIDRKTALRRLRTGAILHREFREELECWWIESPHAEVPAAIAAAIKAKPGKGRRMVPCGDGLFGAATSQSWLMERAP